MAKMVAILAENLYEELELWYPKLRLKEAGFDVRVIAPDKHITYKGKWGYPVEPDQQVTSSVAQQFAAVVIPGGFAPDYMRRVAPMTRFVREMWDAGKIVAAICHGVWMPISAGIIKDKHATSFFGIADDVKNAGATWEDKEVVVDGNLITSRKPEDLPAFMREVLGKLGQP